MPYVWQDSINEVQEQIGALKESLAVERKKRYNKEIYEEACKDINKYPPHKATKARKPGGDSVAAGLLHCYNLNYSCCLYVTTNLCDRVHIPTRYLVPGYLVLFVYTTA